MSIEQAHKPLVGHVPFSGTSALVYSNDAAFGILSISKQKTQTVTESFVSRIIFYFTSEKGTIARY